MEPNDPSSNPRVEITATFNADNTVTFSQSNSIKFDNRAFGAVIFTLKVAMGAMQARFPSNPIQWVDSSTTLNPIDTPDVARVIRDDDRTTRVRIAASPSREERTFSFFVIVQSIDGKFFGSDPTIVTMPPGT